MNLNKRGQLTIFVILATVAVVGIVSYYFYSSSQSNQKYSQEIETFLENIDSCLTENYEQMLEINGIQGGYINVPEPKYKITGYFFSINVPYYFYEGKIKYPQVQDIEKELSKESKNLALYCLNEYKEDNTFKSVKFTEPFLEVKITNNQINFKTNTVLTIRTENKTQRIDLSKKEITIDSDIYKMREIAEYLANYYQNNNEWTPYTEITQLAKQNNVYISITDSEDGSENTIEISSLNENSHPQNFMFKNKFSQKDLSEIEPLLAV